MAPEKLTEIACSLSDCLYFRCPAKTPSKALCSHQDASRYVLKEPPCPLYRLDWQRKMKAAPAHFFKSAPGAKKF